MLGVILAFVILAVVGAIAPAIAKSDTYGSRLENYIVNNHPKDAADVERLTREYQEKEQRTFL